MRDINKNSPNHYNGRFGWKADMLVCHQTGGTSVEAALKWYLNPGAQCSPHDVIDTNGDIYHLIDYDNASMCNGTKTVAGDHLYYKCATNSIVKSRKTNANYYTYSIEFVHCAKGDINEAQVQAAIWLLKNRIIPHAKSKGINFKVDRQHIIGHCEINPTTRSFCPGKNFPYDRIIAGVLASEYNIKPATAVYQSLGQAAVRSAPDNSASNIKKRCKRGGYYAIKGTLELNGTTWLVHADGSGYSTLKDDGLLFRQCGTYKLYKTTDCINIRKKPEIDPDNILGELESGAEAYVGSANGKWMKIVYEGKIAYAHGDYLKKV